MTDSDSPNAEVNHYQRFDPEESSDAWKTPPSVWRPLSEAVGGFDLDPCTSSSADEIAVEEYHEHGTERQWTGAVWCNPPYSAIGEWVDKAIREVGHERAETVVMLLPARTDTQWFHRLFDASTAVCLREGRIQFYGEDGRASNAPMPVLFAVLGDMPGGLRDVLESWGVLLHGDRAIQSTVQEDLVQ